MRTASIGKCLLPHCKSEIPRLSSPPAAVVVPQNVIVQDDVAVSVDPPGARPEAFACEVEGMPLARLLDVHAEVADHPA